jgi:hypothetical protein
MKLFDANLAWARALCARLDSEHLAARQVEVERVLATATEQRNEALKAVQAECAAAFEARHAADVRLPRVQYLFIVQGRLAVGPADCCVARRVKQNYRITRARRAGSPNCCIGIPAAALQ